MRTVALVLLIISFVAAPVRGFAYSASGFTVTNTVFTNQHWTPGEKGKQEFSFVVTNDNTSKAKTPYVVTFTSNDSKDKVVYKKKGATKLLAPGASQTVKISLTSKSVSKKFKETSYRAEISIDGTYVGGDSFAVTKASSKTASIIVSTPYDGGQLPKGTSLPVNIDVSGELPKGGEIWLSIVSDDGWTRSPTDEPIVLPKGFSGRKTYTIPFYRVKPSDPFFESNAYQYISGRLAVNGSLISEDGADAWIWAW
jgi:hypothetical protein